MDSVRCINRQLISEKDTFLWISRGNLKAETEDEIIAVQVQVTKTNIVQQKQYNQKQIANADSVENMKRQWTALYQHAHYFQNNIIYRDTSVCSNTYKYARK
jgi:hypothetical protein